MTKMNKIS